jgi:predicted transcriptional regulator
MTLTIELPEDLAAQLASLPEEERNRYAVAALREKLAEDAADEADLPPLTAEDLSAIGRGIADSDAGRVKEGAAVFAKLRQRLGL